MKDVLRLLKIDKFRGMTDEWFGDFSSAVERIYQRLDEDRYLWTKTMNHIDRLEIANARLEKDRETHKKYLEAKDAQAALLTQSLHEHLISTEEIRMVLQDETRKLGRVAEEVVNNRNDNIGAKGVTEERLTSAIEKHEDRIERLSEKMLEAIRTQAEIPAQLEVAVSEAVRAGFHEQSEISFRGHHEDVDRIKEGLREISGSVSNIKDTQSFIDGINDIRVGLDKLKRTGSRQGRMVLSGSVSDDRPRIIKAVSRDGEPRAGTLILGSESSVRSEVEDARNPGQTISRGSSSFDTTHMQEMGNPRKRIPETLHDRPAKNRHLSSAEVDPSSGTISQSMTARVTAESSNTGMASRGARRLDRSLEVQGGPSSAAPYLETRSRTGWNTTNGREMDNKTHVSPSAGNGDISDVSDGGLNFDDDYNVPWPTNNEGSIVLGQSPKGKGRLTEMNIQPQTPIVSPSSVPDSDIPCGESSTTAPGVHNEHSAQDMIEEVSNAVVPGEEIAFKVLPMIRTPDNWPATDHVSFHGYLQVMFRCSKSFEEVQKILDEHATGVYIAGKGRLLPSQTCLKSRFIKKGIMVAGTAKYRQQCKTHKERNRPEPDLCIYLTFADGVDENTPISVDDSERWILHIRPTKPT